MAEQQPKRLSGDMTNALNDAPKSSDNPYSKQAGLDKFVDQVLTAQGAELTKDNRETIREKIGHIVAHRS